ncbi:MAG: ABC transporter permease [Actinomycetota bacterium]|nr:ABC transporter permease [Actinomycetota bacterium]
MVDAAVAEARDSLSNEVDTRAVPRSRWRELLATRASAIFLLDVLLFIVFTVLSSHGVFASLADVKALLLAGTEALLLAVGLSLMLGAGIFDLSLGANLVLSSVVGAKIINALAITGPNGTATHVGVAALAGVGGALATGALFGLVNGSLIAYARINSLIATLGTLGIGMGIAYVVTNGSDVAGLPTPLQQSFGLRTVGPIPLPALVALAVAAVAWLSVRFTRFGTRTLAIGSSRVAASRAGIRVTRYIVALAALAGTFAGIAGFIDISHYGSTVVNGHANDALNAVTAAVIGGTLLEGGRVSIPGAVWGTALAVILQGGLVVIGVSSYYQLMAVGGALILAVGLDRFTVQRREQG